MPRRLHGLTDKAVKEQKAVNRIVRAGRSRRRPTNKRRRHAGGGSTGSRLVVAMFQSGVPAASIDSEEETAGLVEADAETKAGARILKWNDDGTKRVADTDIGDDGYVDAVNDSYTPFRASETAPVIAQGFLETVDGTQRFTIFNRDPRSAPQYDKSSKQIEYHPADSDAFALGGEEC